MQPQNEIETSSRPNQVSLGATRSRRGDVSTTLPCTEERVKAPVDPGKCLSGLSRGTFPRGHVAEPPGRRRADLCRRGGSARILE